MLSDQSSTHNLKKTGSGSTYWQSFNYAMQSQDDSSTTSETWKAPVKSLVYPDGAYRGQVDANNLRQGHGEMRWKNGAVYEGEWNRDQIDGNGKYIWPEGMRYEGQFKANRIDGKGVGTWPDGESYDGEWTSDKRNGSGIVTLPSGRLFIGLFSNDFPIRGQTIEESGAVFDTRFDGSTYISDWAPRAHVLVGQADPDALHLAAAPHWMRAFEWADGRRFAGACRRDWSPLAGTLTEPDGAAFLVTYDGSRGFADPLLRPETRTPLRPAGPGKVPPPPAQSALG